jgi:hypothetical protein
MRKRFWLQYQLTRVRLKLVRKLPMPYPEKTETETNSALWGLRAQCAKNLSVFFHAIILLDPEGFMTIITITEKLTSAQETDRLHFFHCENLLQFIGRKSVHFLKVTMHSCSNES